MTLGQRKTWNLDEFHGGIDLRSGYYSTNQTSFRTRDNVYTTKGKKIRRRPPLKKEIGFVSALSKGFLSIDGVKYVFQKRGSSSANTATGVETLLFDNPDYCTGWSLLDFGNYNNHAYALISHDYASGEYTNVVYLHL